MGKRLVLTDEERRILLDLAVAEDMPPADLVRWLLWRHAVEKRVWTDFLHKARGTRAGGAPEEKEGDEQSG